MIEKKIGLYVRVSTEAQAEVGYSIDAQKECLLGLCTSKSWKNHEFYVDAGYSGSNLLRPALQKMLEDVGEGKLSTVVVLKLDRLSRSQKDTLYLIEEVFLPNKVDIVSLGENLDTTSSYGRAMIGILSAFAQLERENIFERTRMGMLERVKQGYWMGGGATPYGYDYDSTQGILVPNGDGEKVEKIFSLYIKGFSAQRISQIMELKQDKNVTNILKRQTYLGVIPYKDKVYPGRHKALISKETFDVVQEKMRQRSVGGRATEKGLHLLSGLVYCGVCGTKMRYIKWGNKGYKLRCYGRDQSKKYLAKVDDCNQVAVWAEELEQVVVEDLFHVSILDSEDGTAMAYADPLVEVGRAIEAKEKALKRLYGLYGLDGDDTLLETIQELKEAIAALKKQLEEEKASRATSRKMEETWNQIKTVRDGWAYFTAAEKQNFIREFVEKIVITGEKAEVFYRFITV